MKTRKFLTGLGMVNIGGGIFLFLIFFLLQGIFIFPLGVLFIIFGVGVIRRKFYPKLLFFGMVPVSILFFLMVIMLGTSDSVPEYYKTPLLIQIVLTLPILFIVGADVIIFTRSTISRAFQNK